MSLLQGLLLFAQGLVASTALPALAWLLARTYRRRAAARRLAWVVTFVVLLALPLLALVAPSLFVVRLDAAPPPLAAAAAPAAVEAAPGWSLWSALLPLGLAVWLAGVAKLAVEHLVALVRLELMRRRAIPWRPPLPLPIRGCAVRLSEDCPGPMTWGVLRPVILLPDEAAGWPVSRLEAVLRHELAHVRRRDGLAQALALVVCALYWPNPLVWAAARALRREAELAADDAVIAAGVLPSDYAGELLALASEWRERRLTTTGLAMAAPPALSRRVQSALSTDAIRTGATAMDTVKLVLVGGVAAGALTLARPSVAESPPAPPSAPASVAAPQAPAPAPAPAPASPAGAPAPHDAQRPLRVAQQDVQRAPPEGRVDVRPVLPDEAPAPAAPLAPPAPPAVSAPAAPPPAPPPAPRVRAGKVMTPEERAELERDLAQIGPTINKAIADAHINELVQQELSAQDAKTREMVARQLADIGPRIQRAIANAHIQDLVAQKMAEIQPQIDAALARARENGQRAQERAERAAERAQERAKRAEERARERDTPGIGPN